MKIVEYKNFSFYELNKAIRGELNMSLSLIYDEDAYTLQEKQEIIEILFRLNLQKKFTENLSITFTH